MKKGSNLVKNVREIDSIRRACQIASQLHLLAMSSDLDNETESQLLARLEKFRKISGNHAWAFPVIVGSGPRATILHAKPTKRQMSLGETLVLDLGLRVEGYCSDITRTWPIGGQFSSEQREIYNIVLSAQKAVVSKIKPGTNLTALHELCLNHLNSGLKAIGIPLEKDATQYFPHKASHWIGRVVHDPCPYNYADGTPIVLSEGMCMTVEPGLYFKNGPSKFQGIGVRLEDVVLVTKDGCEVLSTTPKEAHEVEAIRSWARTGKRLP